MSSLRRELKKLFDEADLEDTDEEDKLMASAEAEPSGSSESEIDVDDDHMLIGGANRDGDHMLTGRGNIPLMDSSSNEHFWGQLSSSQFGVSRPSNSSSFRTALAMVQQEQQAAGGKRTSGSTAANAATNKDAKLRRRHETLGAVFDTLDRNGNGLLDREGLEILFCGAVDNIRLRLDEDRLKEVVGAAIDVLMKDVFGEDAVAEAEASMRLDSSEHHSAMDVSMSASNRANRQDFGAMDRYQFICMFDRHPDLLTVFASERRRLAVLRQNSKAEEDEELEAQENEQIWRTSTQWMNHRMNFVWLAIYILATAVAFSTHAYRYSQVEESMEVMGTCLVVARGSAMCLNLNCALILIPIAKHLTTYLRSTRARFYLPLDASVEIHKILGAAILFWTTCHVSAHVCNHHRIAHAEEEDLKDMMGGNPDLPPDVWGRWRATLFQDTTGITGILMVVCILVAYPLTLVRRDHFNVFWNSHHLLLVMLLLMCFHDSGKSIFWLIIPLVVYTVPRSMRETANSRTKVIDAYLKKGEVLCLRVQKPKSWDANLKAGMYAMINIPKISSSEWHPFTLTSAPSDPYLEFHIRDLGDFTHTLHSHVGSLQASASQHQIEKKMKCMLDMSEYSGIQDKTTHGSTEFDYIIDVDDLWAAGPSSSSETDYTLSESLELGDSHPIQAAARKKAQPQTRVTPNMAVYVDGPFGASSQGFSDYPIMILVGAGIGVTPMISVLKDLLVNPGKMERVYFYWTVRDRDAFDWFSGLMDKIYKRDQKKVLQVRHFLTSVKDDDRDIGAVLLNHARRSKFQADSFDLILGQQTHHHVNVGRPDWKDELRGVKEEAKRLGHAKCGIFLCGPDKMAQTIEGISRDWKKRDPTFRFLFHKETFQS